MGHNVGNISAIVILLQSARFKGNVLHLANFAVQVIVNVECKAAIVRQVLSNCREDVIGGLAIVVDLKVIDYGICDALTLDKPRIAVATLCASAGTIKYRLGLLRVQVICTVGLNSQGA